MHAYAEKKQINAEKAKADLPKKNLQMRSDSPNVTEIPDALKARFENLPGLSFGEVCVQHNSDKPAQLQAAHTQENRAYDQGREKIAPNISEPVVQLMPWHVKGEFPRDELQTPATGAAPNTPITGYKFVGYTYNTRRVLDSPNQTAATTSAAELLATLSPPKIGDMLAADEIANYRNQPITSANGGASLAEDMAAFGGNTAGYAASIAIPTGHALGTPYTTYETLWDTIYTYERNGRSIADLKTAIDGTLLSNAKKEAIKQAVDDATDSITDTLNYSALKAAVKPILKSLVDTNSSAFQALERTSRTTVSSTSIRNASIRDKIDPFHVKVQATVAPLAQQLNLHYQFSRESYGYVVRIDRGPDTFRMANGLPFGVTPTVGYYSSAHNTTQPGTLAGLANRATATGGVPANDNAMNDVTFDSITKLAGEGSRWQCVRRNAAILTNQSRFYHSNGVTTYYITFENLWKNWIAFGHAFNIPDADVITKLTHAMPDSAHCPDASFVVGANDVQLV